ncbi:TetR-like C-terminal domain-containing protein [Fodinicola feengrottensis]|uniref:TetR-like C-terminal domain-containing protein n=1 Tax=Fodinicola feengrottensis TaxID=435914 RepID=UPI0013D51CAF|nr:TetR-like C-terminal domain-containing protein [Fodinicola feengrottensis]
MLAAMQHSLPGWDDLPDTGSLRSDLIALLQRVAHRFDLVPGDLIPGLITETFSDPESAAATETFSAGRPRPCRSPLSPAPGSYGQFCSERWPAARSPRPRSARGSPASPSI